MNSAGYSGTPLAKKLGIKANFRVVLEDAPAGYEEFLAPLPEGTLFEKRVSDQTDLIQLFVTKKAVLERRLRQYWAVGKPEVMVWISWPKKASGVATDVTEDTIREVGLPLGFVDIKVCAVDATWSGLKLVVRRELREGKS